MKKKSISLCIITLFWLKIRRSFMKKIYILLGVLLALCAVTNGCIYDKISDGEEENPPGPGPDPGPGDKENIFRMNATVESTPFGKQNMGSDNIGLFLYKNSVDAIESNKNVTLANGAYEYKIESKDSSGYCFAYYPYSSSLISGTTYTGTLSSVQNQPVSTSTSASDIPSSLTNQMLMISDQSNVIKFIDNTASIQFRNVFSLLCFKITKDISLTGFDNQRIKSFDMYMANSIDTLIPLDVLYKFSGTYTIDLKKAPGASGYSGPNYSSSSSARITAQITNSPFITSNSEAPVVIWIVVPPFNFYANKLVVRMETEDDSGVSYSTFSTFSGLGEIARNTLTTFPVNLKKENLYSDDILKESFVNKPANRYVISEPGVYEIAAKKISGEMLNGASADWLWASKEGGASLTIGELISNISFDATAKTIRFRVGSGFGLTKGNVVLALKDASNNIVWTWHIWITNDVKDMKYDGSTFLDRNIGALSADTLSPAIDTYGFVYQWGRKDPFVGGDGITYDESNMPLYVARNHTIINSSAAWGTDVDKWTQVEMTAGTSVDESRKYPMRFFYNGKSSSESDPADWLYQSKTDLWSDSGKTDDDPCPYGYKVPGKDDLKALHNGYNNYELYLNDLKVNPSVPFPSIWFYNRKNSNRYWEYAYNNATTAWPTAGMRQGRNASGKWIGAQLKYAGTDNRMGRAFYWTSTPLSIGGTPVPGSSHRVATNGFILYSSDEYGANADAYPVRCVKMATP
jgi:hypothetical protein